MSLQRIAHSCWVFGKQASIYILFKLNSIVLGRRKRPQLSVKVLVKDFREDFPLFVFVAGDNTRTDLRIGLFRSGVSSKRLFAEVDFSAIAAVNSVILPCNDFWTNEYSDQRFRIFRAQGLQTRLECLSHFTTSNPAIWRFWAKISPLQPFLLDGLKRFSVEILLLPNLTLKLQLHSLHCSFGFIPNSPFAQRDASEMFLNFVLVLHVSWKVYFSSEDRAFYWSIYDSCWQDQMSVRPLRHDKRCGWFSKSWGLSASVSFLSSPPPPRLLAPFFAWPLLRNSTETLASQATGAMDSCFNLLGQR